MRLDELPRSDNVEDRRGDGSGGFPMGRTGGGIGTIILLGLIGTALPGCGRTTQRKWRFIEPGDRLQAAIPSRRGSSDPRPAKP
jgi:predicted metalloprotease